MCICMRVGIWKFCFCLFSISRDFCVCALNFCLTVTCQGSGFVALRMKLRTKRSKRQRADLPAAPAAKFVVLFVSLVFMVNRPLSVGKQQRRAAEEAKLARDDIFVSDLNA